jgi:mannose-6-phosphate isomerase
MWHVLKAEPGAKIAAGFREPVTSEQARAGALDGTIVGMLEWFDAQPGDTFFIPAGTVHAIGAGLTICEIQQQSDITYRFFDYGRGRELHLDSALAVSHLDRHDARRPVKVECDYFVTEPLNVEGSLTLPASSGQMLLMAIEGQGEIDGQPTRAGDVWHVTGSEPVTLIGNLRLLQTSAGV